MMREGTGGQHMQTGLRSRIAVLAVLAAFALSVAACSGVGFSDDAVTSPDAGFGRVGTSNGGEPAPAPGMAAPGIAVPEAPADDMDRASGEQLDGGDVTLPSLETAGRTIIRTGSVDLVVEEVDTSYHRVQQIASSVGGFVADSSFTGSEERQRATLTIRVPADRFQDVIDQLREMALEVRGISTTAQDVTAEYTDMEASLRNLRAVEAQYLELLSRAEEIGDILLVQDRMHSVRDQIERLEGRMRMLDNLADLSTLTVSLRTDAEVGSGSGNGGLGGAVRDAWQASLDALEQGAIAVITVVVFSWWILPVLVVAYVLVRRWRRNGPVKTDHVDTPVEAA